MHHVFIQSSALISHSVVDANVIVYYNTPTEGSYDGTEGVRNITRCWLGQMINARSNVAIIKQSTAREPELFMLGVPPHCRLSSIIWRHLANMKSKIHHS